MVPRHETVGRAVPFGSARRVCKIVLRGAAIRHGVRAILRTQLAARAMIRPCREANPIKLTWHRPATRPRNTQRAGLPSLCAVIAYPAGRGRGRSADVLAR